MADCKRKTANLFDINAKDVNNGYVNDAQLNQDGTTSTWGSAEISEYIPISGDTVYTFNGIGSYNASCYALYDENKQLINAYRYIGRSTINFTSPNNARYFRFTHIKTYTQAMMVEGSYTSSTMPEFEPYWQRSLRKLGTATDTITTLPADLYADGNTATVGLVGNMSQSGTPTPTTPITPSECGDLETSSTKAGQYKIPISSGQQTTNIYLGSTQTTRQIKKYVLTGNETVRTYDTTYERIFVEIPNFVTFGNRATPLISTHYQGIYDERPIYNVPMNSAYSGSVGNYGVYIKEDSYTSSTDFKEYLAAQYAAGTPVTIWYAISTPETAVVNEPLRKIGEYADTVSGITIPTITGKDTFDVETTLKPSEVSLSYTGWHDATVKEKSENLWDEDYTNISSDIYYKPVYVGNYEIVTVSSTVPLTSQNFANLFALGGQQSSGASTGDNGVYSGRSIAIRPVDGYITIAYRNANGVNPQDYDTMANEGRTPLPYEPYWK